MWVRNILANNVPWFFLYLCLLADDFDSFATGAGGWFHNIHMLHPWIFSVNTEFTIIVWKDVWFWTKTEFIPLSLKHFLSSRDILPHQIFPSQLETLWKMIDLLVFGSIFQYFWLTHTCPHYVPLRAIWWNNTDASSFHRVHYWVIDVCGIMNFETKCHIFIKHFVLMDDLQQLVLVVANILCNVSMLKKWILGAKLVTIGWIWKQNSYWFVIWLQGIRLNKIDIHTMWFEHTSWYFPFFPIKHQVSNIGWIIPFKLVFVFAYIKILWWIRIFNWCNRCLSTCRLWIILRYLVVISSQFRRITLTTTLILIIILVLSIFIANSFL